MHRLLRALFLSTSLLLALPAGAAVAADLYQVREPMNDMSRDDAMQKALATLVLRLTGDPEAVNGAGLAALRKDPSQAMISFGQDGDDLVVEFDPQSVDRALREAGLPLWDGNRPTLLVWWLGEDGGEPRLIGESQTAADLIRHAAQHRGLPVRLPLADLQEQIGVDADSIVAGGEGTIDELSARYEADGRLLMVARETDAGWQGDWQLVVRDNREQGSVSAASEAELADAVMLQVSRNLATRYAVAGSAQTLQVLIENVDFSRYAEIERLLKPLEGRLISMGGGELKYQVRATPEQVTGQLESLGLRQSEPDMANPAMVSDTNELRFR